MLLIASIRQQVHCSNSAASLGPLLCCAECRQLCGAASLAPAIQSPFARIKGVIEGKKSLAIHIACVCRKGSRRRGPNYSQLGANWRCIRRFFSLINTLDGSCKPIRACIQGWFANIQGSKRRSKLLPRVMFQHPRVESLLIFQALVRTLKMRLPSKATESWLDKGRKTGMAGFWQVTGVILQAGCMS